VFSEVCRVLRGRGHAIEHVLETHLLTEVVNNTWLENGKVFGRDNGRRFGYAGKFFVDPRDGTLREQKRVRDSGQAWARPYDRVHWKEGLWFVRIKGNWFLGCYTPDPARATDLPKGCEPQREERERNGDWFWPNVQVGREKHYFVKWKQANRRELGELRRLCAEQKLDGTAEARPKKSPYMLVVG
jgi:hypothetical protein